MPIDRRTFLPALLGASAAHAQSPAPSPGPRYFDVVRDIYPMRTGIKRMSRRELQFPPLGEYRVVTGDFHIHTLYSEGTVMPSVRLYEAWTEGVDVVAITDHAEFLRTSLPEKRGRAFEEVRELAAAMGLLLIRGAEVSTVYSADGELMSQVTARKNTDFIVLFVEDENALFAPFDVAMERARSQGCINIWAHPGPEWGPIPQKFLEMGWLHGVEMRNTVTSAGTTVEQFAGSHFYPQAAVWAREKGLSLIASSDVHSPAQFERPTGALRDFTLLLVKEPTQAGVREALLARRTMAWFDGMVWGRGEDLALLARHSLRIAPMRVDGKLQGLLLRNACSIPLEVEVDPAARLLRLPPRAHTVPALGSAIVPAGVPSGAAPTEIEVRVRNLYLDRQTNLRLPLPVTNG
ncbi:MAG: hypothetical protein FJW39_11360 [Acidobacteria bacterium]|nr:hypothetical protein [Acidobacteriota bacterium]